MKKPGMDVSLLARLAFLGLPPVVFVAGSLSPAPAAAARASIAIVTTGLLVVERWLRRAGFAAVAVPTVVLALYGTGLIWHETMEPVPAAALAFLAGAVLVGAWWRRSGGDSGSAAVRGAALGIALQGVALLAEAVGGAPRLTLAPPLLPDSLFSSAHGLLFWTPALSVGVLGLFRRWGRGHADAAGALAAFTIMAIVNASLRPWWSGGFANARFLPALPLLALGQAEVLDLVRATARRRPLALAAAAGAFLVGWNLLLMAQYRAETIPRDDTVSFPAIVENGARILGTGAGSPMAWPANWLFTARYRLSPERYDLLAGQDVLSAGPARVDIGDPESDAAVLGEGWSVRHPCGEAVCREVEGSARLFLPVVDSRPAAVQVRAQGSGTLRIVLNGDHLASAALGEPFTEVGATVARGRLHRGPNEIVFAVGPGARALVDQVTIVPVETRP